MRDIGGNTKIIALLGWPVSHTLSPAMHNAAFEAMGLDYCYVALPVRPDMLRDAIAGMRALNLAGLNVTVPHKENVMPLLDEISNEASFIGAVNTVIKTESGRLIGHNTDGRGFMKALEEDGIDPSNKLVLIIGTGGGARAISYYLADKSSELMMFDVDMKKAERLVSDLSINHKNIKHLKSLGEAESPELIINATPLGLKETDPLPLDEAMLKPGVIVGDLIYKETRLQRECRSRGIKTFHGLGMLLWQGVFASELWTGQRPPHDVMKRALVKGMGK